MSKGHKYFVSANCLFLFLLLLLLLRFFSLCRYSVIVLDRILPETDLTSPIEEMFPADIYL